jgi:hypothetical protein
LPEYSAAQNTGFDVDLDPVALTDKRGFEFPKRPGSPSNYVCNHSAEVKSYVSLLRLPIRREVKEA